MTISDALFGYCNQIGATSPNVLRVAFTNKKLFSYVDSSVSEEDVVVAKRKNVVIVTDRSSKTKIAKIPSLSPELLMASSK